MPRRRRSPRQAPQAQHAQTPGAEQAQQASNADTHQLSTLAQLVAPAARPPSPATDRATIEWPHLQPLCDEVEAMAIVRRPADEGEGQAAAAFLAASPITRETPATVASQYAITPLVEGEEEEEEEESGTAAAAVRVGVMFRLEKKVSQEGRSSA